jgi:hypothetical protein
MSSAKSYESIDISTVRLAPPKVSKSASGCKTSKIQGPGNQPIQIQTPLMTLPWDIAPRKMDENSGVSANLALSFLGMDPADDNDDLRGFRDFLLDFDIKVKTLISDMKGTLGKKSEEANIDANFKDSIKESTSGEYPPTIQPKIWLSMRDGGDSKCVGDFFMDIGVFNFDGEELDDHQVLTKGCPAAAIIEPSYVWCSTLGLGITWVAKQVAIKPVVEKKFAFTLGPKFDHLKEPAPKKQRTIDDDKSEKSDIKSDQTSEKSDDKSETYDEGGHVDF